MNIRGERGVVLGMVLITSVIFGIAAFGLLSLAMNPGQAIFAGEGRTRARYAAEAGLVWAMQELWVTPSDCFFGPYVLDTDDDGAPETTVNVTRIPIPPGPCLPSTTTSKLQAKVIF